MTPSAPRLAETLRGRVLFVSGKGGTGKSAVALAIARSCAEQGRRTLLVELDAQHPTLPGLVGVTPTYEAQRVAGGLSVANLLWAESLDDWLRHIIGAPRLVRGILRNRVVSLFLEATPGARDLVVLTRVLQLSRDYDTVVVDMPASGNAIAMLNIAHTAQRLFETGPVRRCADELLALYARKDVRVVLVALPEEMVVNETLETAGKLARDCAPLRLGGVVLNRATMPSADPRERAAIAQLAARGDLPPEARALVDAGAWDLELEDATAEALSRLGAGLGDVPVVALPALPRGEAASRVADSLTRALARAVRGAP
jgi:anion-transporting  ArsA/GET3 family ATPase